MPSVVSLHCIYIIYYFKKFAIKKGSLKLPSDVANIKVYKIISIISTMFIVPEQRTSAYSNSLHCIYIICYFFKIAINEVKKTEKKSISEYKNIKFYVQLNSHSFSIIKQELFYDVFIKMSTNKNERR